MAKDDFDDTWMHELRTHVAHRPIVILRLEEREVQGLKETHDGMRQFSLARAHAETGGIATPCICLFFAGKPRPFGGQLVLLAPGGQFQHLMSFECIGDRHAR